MITIAAVLHAPDFPYQVQHGEHDTWAKLGPMYAYRLFSAVRKYTDSEEQPRCVLFTNVPERCDSVQTLGVELLPLVHRWPGWWSKLNLFEPGVLTGNVLYLDLDVVVCGNLSGIFALNPRPLIMLPSLEYPGLFNGSVMLARVEPLGSLWHELVQTPGLIERWTRGAATGDSSYIADRVTMLYGKRGLPWGSYAREATIVEDERVWRIPFFDELLPLGAVMHGRIELECARRRPERQTMLVYGDTYRRLHESSHAFYREHWQNQPYQAVRNADPVSA